MLMNARTGKPAPPTLEPQLEARTRAIAKVDDRPHEPVRPSGLYAYWMGTPPRRPIHTVGHALQRAAVENA